MNNRPIGVFDSGLGGLTVASSLKKIIPQEKIIYFADTAHVPYGERCLDEICSFALDITGYLINRGAKMVVMACNMSSAVALDTARAKYSDVPIIGVIENGARAAIQHIRNVASPRIGVLATTGTVNSGAYTKTILNLCPQAKVFEQPCPLFVPIVENGLADTEQAYDAARQYTSRFVDEAINAVILGCTHYPFLISPIKKALGPSVSVIDPADESAREAARMLKMNSLVSNGSPDFEDTFIVSGDPKYDSRFIAIGSQFLGRSIKSLEHVKWGVHIGKVKV